MRRILALSGTALGLSLFGASSVAHAQFGFPQQPNQTPILSPYLNLNRPGNPGINYFDLVRPQVDTAKQMLYLQQQQQQQLGLMSQLGAGPTDVAAGPTNMSITGHPATFFNYSHYFGQAGGTYGPMPLPPGVLGLQKR